MVYICTTCGGTRCQYCGHNWSRFWHPSGKRYAGYSTEIEGVFANWVTPNMLALSRPSSRILKQYRLLEIFKEADVRKIFCLEEYGEHPHCGDKLAPGSGFSYHPDEFTNAGIAFSNPAWEDLGVPSFELMEQIVNEAKAVLDKGGKVAVHCHAGLGRTGLVIACTLIAGGMTADQALEAVRQRRPLSVQSTSQEEFLVRFKEYLDAKGAHVKL